MFRGRFLHTIDEKGRIMIPAKFRDELRTRYDECLIVTNFDGCLVAYPREEWHKLEEKLMQKSMVKREVKAFVRFFVSGATECSLDDQGRVLIPPPLREYAELERELVLAGMLNKIEIWNKQKWDHEISTSGQNIDQLTEALADLGI